MVLNGFNALKGCKTPIHLYDSLDPSLQTTEKHEEWLQQIREVVKDQVFTEESRIPTYLFLWCN